MKEKISKPRTSEIIGKALALIKKAEQKEKNDYYLSDEGLFVIGICVIMLGVFSIPAYYSYSSYTTYTDIHHHLYSSFKKLCGNEFNSFGTSEKAFCLSIHGTLTRWGNHMAYDMGWTLTYFSFFSLSLGTLLALGKWIHRNDPPLDLKYWLDYKDFRQLRQYIQSLDTPFNGAYDINLKEWLHTVHEKHENKERLLTFLSGAYDKGSNVYRFFSRGLYDVVKAQPEFSLACSKPSY